MLDALGAPIAYSTTAQYESIAIKLMKVTEVKILIVDELHNLLAGNNNVQREFLNALYLPVALIHLPVLTERNTCSKTRMEEHSSKASIDLVNSINLI
jgi:hypothetical protein